jgi:hypothetical protein
MVREGSSGSWGPCILLVTARLLVCVPAVPPFESARMFRHGLDALVPAVAAAAKTHYGTSLANVDWLHGSAESLLTVTNLLIGEGTCSAAWPASMWGAGTCCVPSFTKGLMCRDICLYVLHNLS